MTGKKPAARKGPAPPRTQRLYCKICGQPAFESQLGGFFHDVQPRFIATRVREVTGTAGTVISLPDL